MCSRLEIDIDTVDIFFCSSIAASTPAAEPAVHTPYLMGIPHPNRERATVEDCASSRLIRSNLYYGRDVFPRQI